MGLGEFIENTRQLKHVTIAKLTEATGVSATTYSRMRHERTDVKLQALMAILDKLRLQMADIVPVLTADYLDCERQQDQIDRQLVAVVRREAPAASLARLQETLPAVIHQHAGLALAQPYLRLMQAKLADDQVAAADLARELFARLQRRTYWTHWEHQLCLPTLNYLTWAQLQAVYREHLAQAEGDVVVDEYLAMLTNVLSVHQATEALIVLGWWQARYAQDLAFAPYLRFATLLANRLRGHSQQAAWEQLQVQLRQLWGGAQNAPLAIMQRMWQLAAGLVCAEALPKIHAVRHTDPFAADSITAGVGELRHAKHLPADRLWQELYISKAAYYRQFARDASLKSNEFFAALDSLQVQGTDLLGLDAYLGLDAGATQAAIAADLEAIACGRQPSRALDAWQAHLQARLAATGNCAYHQLALWVDVEQAKGQHQRFAAMKAALKLYRELIDYEGWNAFEYSLVIAILPFLPFAQGQFLFSHYLDAAESTRLAVRTPQELDELYLGLLASALAEGDAEHVALALRWIKKRRLTARAVAFRTWQRLAELLLAPTPDPAAFSALQATVAAVFQTTATSLQTQLETVWQQAISG